MSKKCSRVFSMVCALLVMTTLGFAQGTLTPPGAPAPTMKTLAQIEPRTPISAATTPGDTFTLYIINQPGSYYFTTNIVGVANKSGIFIQTGNVTIDLNGFTLQGVLNSFTGIYVAGPYTNIVIHNGTVSGWGDIGLDAYNAGPVHNVIIEHLTASANASHGIAADNGSEIRHCSAYKNGNSGIVCYGGLVADCVSDANTLEGILGQNCIVQNCRTKGNAANGISVYPGMVSDCLSIENGFSGIFVNAPGSKIIRNTCYSNNTLNHSQNGGITINDSSSRIEDNVVTANTRAGIRVLANYTNNLVIKNNVTGNGTNNYILSTNQVVGPLISTTGTITNSNPWANFSY
ncbi:MAG: hypothetical protein JWM68_5095 [Verrucomicrobiales bacterium]|nr:hypothetical protein [Verrucomicrobiales bacterium]